MIVLGLDTATASTAVGLRLADGTVLERRDDPPAGAHPGHATRLLAMIAELLRQAGSSWGEVERIAVGVGPGTFTGLRVGVATARGLAHSRSIPLVGVSSLQALALGALEGDDDQLAGEAPNAVIAVIDARRGEVFAAPYERGGTGAPRALAAPARGRTRAAGGAGGGRSRPGRRRGRVAAGRRRSRPLPRAAERCRVATGAGGIAAEQDLGGRDLRARRGRPRGPGEGRVLPDYVRRPDAELALEGARRMRLRGHRR